MTTYNFTSLDVTPGGTSLATGINHLGQIVGYFYNGQHSVSNVFDVGQEGAHGFLYSGGNYSILNDPLGTFGTVTRGISTTGQITYLRKL